MKLLISIIACAAAALGILSCNSDTVGPPAEKAITGVVTDSAGRPVPGALLNMFYLVAYRPLGKPAVPLPTTVFEFDVPHPGVLRVSIENYTHDTIRILHADTVAAGWNLVEWDFTDNRGRSMYSDVYSVTGTLDDSLLRVFKVFAVVEQQYSENPAPFALTDRFGRFSIPLSRLPVNEVFTRWDYNGDSLGTFRIGPKDLLVAFTPGFYGYDTVDYSHLRDLTIKLTHSKSP